MIMVYALVDFQTSTKKSGKNSNLQKIQLITFKNSSRKPVKSRAPRGYRRNGSKPEIPKRKREHQIYPREKTGYADA